MMLTWWCVLLSICLPAGTPAVESRPVLGASAVLHDWDDRRAAAWAGGDAAELRSLYVPGSAVGREDVAMLRTWRARGLRVVGMRMQLLDLDVRRSSASRLDLVVTDRLVGAVARGPGVRLPLPRDGLTTRHLVLVRDGDEWRVRQASAVRTTSWTVRSRKE